MLQFLAVEIFVFRHIMAELSLLDIDILPIIMIVLILLRYSIICIYD